MVKGHLIGCGLHGYSLVSFFFFDQSDAFSSCFLQRCGREELHKQTKQQMDHSFETTYKSAHTILCLVVSQPRISYIFLQGLCQLQNYA